MTGVGFAVPINLLLEITAIVCGALGVFMKLTRRKLMSNAQKHYGIKTLADSKLNSIKIFISKALKIGKYQNKNAKLFLNNWTSITI